MTDGYLVCPECGDEYTLTASVCAECGVPLVDPGSVERPPEPEAFPEIDALVCVRVGPLPWTRALSETLSEAEVEHRVERDERKPEDGGIDPERFGGELLYGTWVRPEDHERAVEIDRSLFAHFEPEDQETVGGEEVCPACAEPIQAEALECAGCGLHFG